MKPTSNTFLAIFAFIWIASIKCESAESLSARDQWKYNMPSFFKRTYKLWSRNNTCNYERMKSLNLELKTLRNHRYRLTTLMAQGGFPLNKAELRLEFYGISNKTEFLNKTYFAEIQPLNIDLELSPIKSSSTYIDEDLVELTFDITEFYNEVNMEDMDVLRFRLRLLKGNHRIAKRLSRTTMKPFVIVYEKLKSCGFQDAFRSSARDKRSRGINLETDFIPEGNTTVELGLDTVGSCHMKESLVTFAENGMDFVIYPSYYRTSDCVLDLDLYRSFDVADMSEAVRRSQFACCVPTDFEYLTMVFEDVSNDGRPVMSKFNDIAAKRCGCRLI